MTLYFNYKSLGIFIEEIGIFRPNLTYITQLIF
ncbi:hypothetical protein ZORO111903_05020 [Zobellia roscoffensis]